MLSFKNTRGLSLIELLITLIILSILLTIAIPNISGTIRRMQAESTLYAIISASQLARSTAISKRQSIIFCASANQLTCGNNWNDGAIVFNDPNGNRQLDSNEKIITTIPAVPEGSQLLIKAALNKQYLRYMNNGLLENTSGSFIYCPANGRPEEARNLIFNRTGRMRFGTDKNKDGIYENAAGQPIRCPL